MNSSEHKFICDLLVESIQDLTTFVVYLNSSQTQTMSSVFKQFCDIILKEVIKSADLEEKPIEGQTFENVFKLYEQFVINSNEFCSPIVFFLDEIENFDKTLITSLILIIKEYLQTIPFIIIMVKSNETISLQHLLPSRATDYLIVHHFHSSFGHKIVEKIIEEFLIESSLPFKLGSNVLEFMIKISENFNYSIQNTHHFIKCCLFKHFYSNELSFFCQSISELKSFVKNNDMKAMKALLRSKLFDCSLDNKEFKKSLVKSVSEFVSIHNQFINNLKVLLILLKANNCDISLTQLYVNFLNKSFDFKQIIHSLNRLSQIQWKNCFDNCLIDSSVEETAQPLIEVLKSCQKALIEAIDEQKSEPQVLIERLDMSDVKNKLTNLKTRHQWKEIINPSNKPKVLTKFEIWKKTTIDSIMKAITEIPHPMSSPMNEILFFDDLNALKPNVFVVLRNDIHKSLSNGLHYELNNSPEQSLTDFHKFFSIYIESQTIFNMFDGFQAFQQLLNQKSKTEDTKNENIVRFVNTVSDFEYMGLIESAKHKTDHLMRLIWF